ncbi:CHAT domain-containing protein [Spirosoma sp. HMF3257]|nr:CHAT domain-containing protein [Spirosoma telluris]
MCFQLRLENDSKLVLDPQWLVPIMMAPEEPAEVAPPEEAVPVPASPLRPGQMDYAIPDAMVQGQSTTCIIRLGDKDVKDMQISGTSVHASIQVCDEMSVKLVDLDEGNFKIRSLSSEQQALVKGEYTEWKINVTPLATGSFPLLLQVSCHFDGKTKDVAVLEKSIQVTADPSQMPRTRKIAFIAAGSKTGLLLGKESNEIWEELRLAPFRDDFSYVKYFEVTNIQFDRALEYEKPTIVHFSGHGSMEGIFLADEQGNPKLASSQDMAGLFQVLQTDEAWKIECVVLNACLSRDLAQELAVCVPTVIGTNTKIGDDKAILFSECFYRELGKRRTYQQAFDSGRIRVGVEEGEGLDEGRNCCCVW